MFYKPSQKELLDARHKIFLDKAMPALYKCHFHRSPFSTSNFGRNNLNDFTYTFCRIVETSLLEILIVRIAKGDIWIKIYINIFRLFPKIQLLKDLEGKSGLQFMLPPNNNTEMRFRVDDYKVLPIFRRLIGKQHKINPYCTKKSFSERIIELGELIEEDIGNIDLFVKRWHELHEPLKTDWEGHKV